MQVGKCDSIQIILYRCQAEDGHDLVASKDRKGMSPMDVVAVLTNVVQEQQENLRGQRKTIYELQKRIARLEKKS